MTEANFGLGREKRDVVKKVSPEAFAQLIKAKYPVYKDIPDLKLTHLVLKKFPIYEENVDWGDQRIGDIDIK